MKVYATLSADVVSSTTLDKKGMVLLSKRLSEYVKRCHLEDDHSWGRVVRGDGVECVFSNAKDALRQALLLRFQLKTFNLKGKPKGLDARIAIAIGHLRTNDRIRGIIDGEAIYASGRALAKMSQITDGVMSAWCLDAESLPALEAVVSLVDFLTNHMTVKQSEVLIYKLNGFSDGEIARKLKVSRANISIHLKRAGWDALESALIFFGKTFS